MKCTESIRHPLRGGALVKILVFLIVLGCILAAAWVFYLPALLVSTLEKRTGFAVKIERLTINPFTARAEFVGLVLHNPGTFSRPEFVEVRSFYANAELKTMFSDRPVINEAVIDVAQVSLVRNAEGTLNARLFNDRLFPREMPADPEPEGAKKPRKPGPSETPEKEPKKPLGPPDPPMQFLIKRLELKLDRLLIEDRVDGKPSTHEYALNFKQTYENVTDPKQLVASVATRSLSSVGAAISGLIPGDLGRSIDAATKSGKDLLKTSTKKSGDALKGLVDTLEESKKP